jgi:type I restriction enzyme S subunit
MPRRHGHIPVWARFSPTAVDALMALCDRLEASLTATAATRRRLLDALLAEALAPEDQRELEAAE